MPMAWLPKTASAIGTQPIVQVTLLEALIGGCRWYSETLPSALGHAVQLLMMNPVH
ncbi:hypothetical protein ACSS6W_009199 [Trichoderma asperelloides]